MANSWVPPKGKRAVAPGPTLVRALHARKSGGPPTGKSRHIREFYSFRYNFKPPSVDAAERGRITVAGNNVTVERPSTQSSEAHRWCGQETAAKEWDCVLIYDEASNSYTLEKLESVLTLTHQPRASGIEAPVPTASLNNGNVPEEDEDADGDADDYFDEILPKASKEEEEGEFLPMPPPPAAVKPAWTKAAPPSAPATKPAVKVPPKSVTTPAAAKLPAKPKALPLSALPPAPPPASAPVPKARPKPVPLPRGKKHRRDSEPAAASASHHLSDADEEDLQFGKPAKRARPSPPQSQPPSRGLALPGASAPAYIPPAPAPAPPVEPIEVGSESEEDEEWDEVAAVGKAADPEDDFDIFGDAAGGADDGDDIGMDELEREINLHMDEGEEDEEDEDFLAAVVEEAPPSRGAPMSLEELAKGAAYASEDEYSSSDESDDD
ncbi:hypothetical protein DXG01_006333 [Tephrocybe rancida]|nr:hypothetical protein DXG01_006333 [Tephrocybe rancida]